jgi:hypothetical protein
LFNRFKFGLFLVYIFGELIQSFLILKLQVPKVILFYVFGQGFFFVLFLYIYLSDSLRGNFFPGLVFDILVIFFNIGLFAINYLFANSSKFCTIGEVDQNDEKSKSETKNNDEGNQEKK